MSCYHPLKGFKIGVHPSGKPMYKICSYETKYVVKDKLGNWNPSYEEILGDKFYPINREYIDIPCGKCVGCLLKRSREWADRCMLEASYHEHNSFITLTYDNEHIPEKREYISIDGEVLQSPFNSLQKKDFQDFMKRFREKISPLKCRFFACGEYGSNTYRPHYHAIIFGYDFPDKQFLKNNFRGEKYYTSELLQSVWKNGISCVADVSWDTCAYVARYCLKKRDNNMNAFYDTFNVDPEFTLMSRKPGIARLYYDDNKSSIYESERIILSDEKGSKIIRPPKYFDRLYDIDAPEQLEEIKAKRKAFVENKKRMELEKTDLDYLDYLKVKEDNFHNRTKIFNERSRINETFEI